MHAIAQIRRREARELVDDPDGRFRLIEARGPCGDGLVEVLDLCVCVADADGDDLCDLFWGLV